MLDGHPTFFDKKIKNQDILGFVVLLSLQSSIEIKQRGVKLFLGQRVLHEN